MRGWLSLLALFVAVAGLGAWVYYRPTAEDDQKPLALSALNASEVRNIRVERSAARAASVGDTTAQGAQAKSAEPPPVIVLQRAEGGWRMTAPFAARAEAFQVERLLSILDTRSSSRFPTTDLGRYGLAEPAVKVTLDGESFAYGAVNTMTREQYVLTRDAVYAIPLTQRNAVPRDADALVSRSLFAPGETPIGFDLPGFAATLQDGTWSFTPQDGSGADERNAWVDAWRQATAVRAKRHDGRTPDASVNVKLGDGRTVAIGILEREPELVLLRADEGIQYHFFADTAKRLLAQPAAKADAPVK